VNASRTQKVSARPGLWEPPGEPQKVLGKKGEDISKQKHPTEPANRWRKIHLVLAKMGKNRNKKQHVCMLMIINVLA
jgi:hypothetical protein